MSTIYTVTKLNNEIKRLLESDPAFHGLFVAGEISNYRPHPSGHHYFTLKDEGAAINAVMFRSDAARLRFRLQNGMKVVARGRVSSYPKSGQVQLYIAELMPDGAGALHVAFEQLKEKLYREGLFDEARKRPLPAIPGSIALVTAESGAAVRDMVRILGRRWPLARVRIFPVLVQGEGAPRSLCRALAFANQLAEDDLIITGRGGGSLEDLWAFNDEAVARAIAGSAIPVISAVGHEPDVTIADFVADLRAPTPSGAAELAVPDQTDVRAQLRQLEKRLETAYHRTLERRAQKVNLLGARLAAHSPAHTLAEKRAALTRQAERLERGFTGRLAERRLAADLRRDLRDDGGDPGQRGPPGQALHRADVDESPFDFGGETLAGGGRGVAGGKVVLGGHGSSLPGGLRDERMPGGHGAAADRRLRAPLHGRTRAGRRRTAAAQEGRGRTGAHRERAGSRGVDRLAPAGRTCRLDPADRSGPDRSVRPGQVGMPAVSQGCMFGGGLSAGGYRSWAHVCGTCGSGCMQVRKCPKVR